jgi:allantoinase
LNRKGDIAEGFDADIALVDPKQRFTVHADASESLQGYTPFEGMELTGRVQSTWLRGRQIWDGSKIIGAAHGQYLHRPYS